MPETIWIATVGPKTGMVFRPYRIVRPGEKRQPCHVRVWIGGERFVTAQVPKMPLAERGEKPC